MSNVNNKKQKPCMHCGRMFAYRQSEASHRAKVCKLNPKHPEYNISLFSDLPRSQQLMVLKINGKADSLLFKKIQKEEISKLLDTSIEEIANENTSTENTSTEDTSTENTSNENTLTEDTSTEEISTEINIISDKNNNQIHRKKHLFTKKNHEKTISNGVSSQKSIITNDKVTKQLEDLASSKKKDEDEIAMLKREIENLKNQPKDEIMFNHYFNKDTDLYQIICDKEGEKWARNYLLYTMPKTKSYIDVITEYIVNIDIKKSPIRIGKDGVLILHTRKGHFEKDPNCKLFQKELINIISNAFLKAFNPPVYVKFIDESVIKSRRINQLGVINTVRPLSYSEKQERDNNQSFITNAQDIIVAGKSKLDIISEDYNRPSQIEYHAILDKIRDYNITDKMKKKFLETLPE